MSDLIRPRTLKGFRDFLPEAAIPREAVIATALEVYRNYGYSPIDTPVLEYADILLGKGSDETDKQTYRFTDHGGRDVAMRFDLTVPFARFAAQHIGVLGTPFKRYHVGPVWRGENTQRGRYREFVQFDFDIIGTESSLADIETILVAHDVFAALGFERFSVRVNDRRVLNGLLEKFGLDGAAVAVLRALDKLPKVGPDGVRRELAAAGADDAAVAAIMSLVGITGSNREVVTQLREMMADSPTAMAGVEGLHALAEAVAALGIDEARVHIDLSIARGLDYYTGMVFETFLDDLPEIGSCCSGGRYADLASLYTKQRLPGVGGSLGVDRLLAAMDELGLVDGRATWAPVLVTVFDDEGRLHALRLAGELRAAGIGAEVFPDTKRLGAQLKYADRRGHRLVVIAGPDERTAGQVQIKDLAAGTSQSIDEGDFVAAVGAWLEA
ncbi:MAG TPA: histidine--tRNA ligase [Acidimicrobiia bacterium]|jgi:histidyl-tRNA synthetase|nr:histidine--tRNA ligase [Acidimicrobiia bacterium]